MRRIILAVSLVLLLPASYLQADPAEYTTTLDDQKGVSITIYNQDLALVKDRRLLRLPEGRSVLAFREVSAGIKPETALLSGAGLSVLEQSFEFDLLTPRSLLKKYVGREVTVVKRHPTTGEESREKARVLSAGDGVVLKMKDYIETGVPGRLIFPDVPDTMRDRPTLVMLVESAAEQGRDAELSYLTTGLGWQADYVAELKAADDSLNLRGWVTLTNQSGATYRNGDLQLVAGDINLIKAEQKRSGRFAKTMAMAAESDSMAEEQMFEYHLYRLDRPITLRDNQTKQVALLQAREVPCRKEFLLQGNSRYYRGQHGEIGKKIKAGVYVEIANSKENNLGIPLPKGVVRVYKKDSGDSLQFVGEDRIGHTPENETVRLKLGDAFDITASKKQIDFKKVSGFSPYNYVYESAYRLELKNGKKERVTVKILEPIPGDWEMLEESLPHEKAAGNAAAWEVEVPSLGGKVLTYRVQVKY